MQDLPINLDLSEGVDRKALRQLTERFRRINTARLARAASALAQRQQIVLDLLPLVFHLNHPALPGYQDHDCPHGLVRYQPGAAALSAAQRLARSFRYRDAGRRRADLEAMFLMGSPGSLGHSVASDLDIWLCHRPDLPDTGIRCLERKAEKLSGWAAGLGIELHVFVFSAADFRGGRPRAEVAGEDCGSAQHFLLLDEFYRTSIHLGGSYPLWWLIPVDQEKEYNDLVAYLVRCRFIREDEYIDFGAVPAVPPEEFLGAGVWQLYKGIDSPWKSILKLLLLECYARDREHGLLSRSFKAAVHGGETDPDCLDPYVLLYLRLERWLLAQGAPGRLQLVRRALYLKAGLPLTRADATGEHWRARLLRHLVDDWGWSAAEMALLDNRHQWRVDEVLALRRSVVSELTHSYRLLSRIARSHGGRAAISAADMNLLGRKLYAAFQRKAGKIEQVNPGLAPTLAEENLAFLHGSALTEGPSRDGWQLFRNLDNGSDTHWQGAIRRAGSLMELVLWSHCNGLLTRATRLNVRGGTTGFVVRDVRELALFLDLNLPPSGPVSRAALEGPNTPLRHLLLINVGLDPQASLTGRGLHKLSGRHDSLGFSGGRENLVASVDQVTLNSWHEVSLQHYTAGDPLIQCLKNILAAIARAPGVEPELAVHGPGGGHGSTIARRVRELFTDVRQHFFGAGRGPDNLRYVIEMGARWFVLQFDGTEPGFVGLDSREALFDYLGRSRDAYVPVVLDRHALLDDPGLRTVCEASQPGTVQVFFQVAGAVARLWVVDELGSVSHWQQPFSGSRRQLLTPLMLFLENLMERRQLRHHAGDVDLLGAVTCHELVEEAGQIRAQRRALNAEELPLGGLDVQAVGVQTGSGELRFDLFCDDREFGAEALGDQQLAAVARYIRACRQGDDHYPVYLTDLHLPHDLDPQVYQQDLQTCQYIWYRQRLQRALSQELGADTP